MKETAHQFWSYLRLLFSKWILWLFLALDAIGAVVVLFFPKLTIPQPAFWGLASIGLLWASFQVYRALLKHIPLDYPPAIQRAVDTLDSANPEERALAIDSLAQTDHPAAREALAAAVQHPVRDVRIRAAFTLAQFMDTRAVSGLIEALDDENWSLCCNATKELGRIGDASAVPALLDALRDEDLNVRQCAARALGQIADADAVAGLADALRDGSPLVSQAAIEALEHIGTAEAQDAVKTWRLCKEIFGGER